MTTVDCQVSFFLFLGGPGSGKVTHCDNLVQEKKEIVHINMSDLLQQYAIGNGEFWLNFHCFYVQKKKKKTVDILNDYFIKLFLLNWADVTNVNTNLTITLGGQTNLSYQYDTV